MQQAAIISLGDAVQVIKRILVTEEDTDAAPHAIFEREAVSYARAAALLDIGARQLFRLIELEKIEIIGEGHHKRVTTKSIRIYRGLEKEKLT
jgi:hypothetical protein